MRKLICGSRKLPCVPWVMSRLADAIQPWDEIITGGAPGADTHAAEFARGLGCKVETYEAEWEKYRNRKPGTKNPAGMIRNQRMIDEGKPEVVLAFPGGDGTMDMIRRAKKARIPVYSLMPDDPRDLEFLVKDKRSPIERAIDEACGV